MPRVPVRPAIVMMAAGVAVASWTALGGVLGVAGARPARKLLSTRDNWHFVMSPGVLALVTATLFGVLMWRIGPSLELIALSVFAAAGVLLAAVDLLEQRLPAVLLLPLYPAVIGLYGLAALVDHQGAAWIRSMLAMGVLLAGFGGIAILSRGGLGAGDVRLAGVLGFVLGWHGWTSVMIGTMLGLAGTALSGVVVLLCRGGSWRQLIPAGPGLLAAAFVVVMVPI